MARPLASLYIAGGSAEGRLYVRTEIVDVFSPVGEVTARILRVSAIARQGLNRSIEALKSERPITGKRRGIECAGILLTHDARAQKPPWPVVFIEMTRMFSAIPDGKQELDICACVIGEADLALPIGTH